MNAQPEPSLAGHRRWPYTPAEYARRAAWAVIRVTLWPLAWRRFTPLRPLLLRAFGARASLRARISATCRIEMPWLLETGREASLGPRVRVYNLAAVTLGDNAVVSQDATLCAGTHDYTDPAYPLLRRPITIGRWAWVAAEAFIGPGVTVGEGAVVGARAVVLHDVEPWTVVAGNPARCIKRRRLAGVHDGDPDTAAESPRP